MKGINPYLHKWMVVKPFPFRGKEFKVGERFTPRNLVRAAWANLIDKGRIITLVEYNKLQEAPEAPESAEVKVEAPEEVEVKVEKPKPAPKKTTAKKTTAKKATTRKTTKK